jgi:hypothetical protein
MKPLESAFCHHCSCNSSEGTVVSGRRRRRRRRRGEEGGREAGSDSGAWRTGMSVRRKRGGWYQHRPYHHRYY